jgi:uncharacterized protein
VSAIQCNIKPLVLMFLLLLMSCGQHTAEYYGYKNSGETTTIAQDNSVLAKLAEAIQANDLDSLKNLIDIGIDLNQLLKNGNPPLIEAILWERVEIVKLLLEKGANRECVDAAGVTAKELAEDASEEIYNIFHPNAGDELNE